MDNLIAFLKKKVETQTKLKLVESYSYARLYKKGEYPHKRIKQVSMIMMVRLNVMEGKEEEKRLARRYHSFLGERTKEKDKDKRKKMSFKMS